ncbi:phage baseplate upper protein [Bacillus atrophaeus]|uniref:phage baseplate upper protein n=1 Tax=Bacillus atrophaeus TaxID=1452 RepID=UPI002E240A3D|nr:phage baseplate upper protein [Bacillus atrophaeus]
MIFRKSALNFDITSYSQSAIRTNIQMSTQDKGTAKLVFYLKKDGTVLPLSGVKAVLTMFFSDGSRSDRDLILVDKVNGIAEYVLSNDEIKHYGKVEAVLNLYYVNKQALSAHEFTFEIVRNLVDRDIVPVAEYYIDDFEKLKVMINKLYDETVQTVEDLRKKFEDLENVETKEGAQEKADAAEAKANDYTDTHANNKKNPHAVTKAQVGLANVDNVKQAAQTDFDAHTADNKRHITADERSKWNGSQLYKITSDDGQHLLGMAGKDLFTELATKRTTTFYSNKTTTNQPPVINSFRGIQIGQDNIGEVLAMGNDGSTWRVTNSNGWKAWEQLETTSGSQSKVDAHANKTDIHVTTTDKESWNDLISQFREHNYNQERHISASERIKWNGKVSYANITLKNGAVAGNRMPIYARWGPFLLFRGHVKTDAEIIFGSIPEAYVPVGGAVVSIALSGTGGTANLVVYENGDLKIKYPDPVDPSKFIGGYYIDAVTGFQEGGTA